MLPPANWPRSRPSVADVEHRHTGGCGDTDRLILIAQQRAASACGKRTLNHSSTAPSRLFLIVPFGSSTCEDEPLNEAAVLVVPSSGPGLSRECVLVGPGVLAEVDRDVAARAGALGLPERPVRVGPGVEHCGAVVRPGA